MKRETVEAVASFVVGVSFAYLLCGRMVLLYLVGVVVVVLGIPVMMRRVDCWSKRKLRK